MSPHPYATDVSNSGPEFYVSGSTQAHGESESYSRLALVSVGAYEDAKPTLITITKVRLLKETYPFIVLKLIRAHDVTGSPKSKVHQSTEHERRQLVCNQIYAQ